MTFGVYLILGAPPKKKRNIFYFFSSEIIQTPVSLVEIKPNGKSVKA